jgi:hypothetical protein
MEAGFPVTVATRKRKACLSCGHRIENGKPAVRVADDNGMQTANRKLRFWLCRLCAEVIERTLQRRRAS